MWGPPAVCSVSRQNAGKIAKGSLFANSLGSSRGDTAAPLSQMRAGPGTGGGEQERCRLEFRFASGKRRVGFSNGDGICFFLAVLLG